MKIYYIAFTVFDDNDKINSDTVKEALENLYRDEYFEGVPNK